MRRLDQEPGHGVTSGSRIRRRSVPLLAASVLLSALVAAPGLQAQTTPGLQGTVTSPDGVPLEGAQVSVTGDQGRRTAVTDDDGAYAFSDLPPGTYVVTASLKPFASVEVPDVVLEAGETLTLNIAMESLAFGGEVVVTVQKRTETLMEIPASITVLSSDTIEQQQVASLLDLEPLVPGLDVVTATPGQTRVTLRGVNTGGVASTVGVYLGDVPFGSSSGLANGAILAGDFDTFDMATIEVLRGPQGTLYGASSLGGVLRYVPNRPTTDRFEARLLGSLETVEDGDLGYSLKGLVNVPLSDTFALRANGFYRFEDGFIDSIGNNPVPSLTNPDVNIIDGTMVKDDINSLDSYGGRLSALYEPSEDLSILVTAHNQTLESDASNIIDADPVTLEPLYPDFVQSRYFDDTVDTEYQIIDATIDWNLGVASLVSVTSYGSLEQDIQTDATIAASLTGGPPLAALVTLLFGDDEARPLSAILPQTTSTDKLTQELRLVSPDNDRFEWLVGAYYTDEDSDVIQQIAAIDVGTGEIAADLPLLADLSLQSTYEEFALFGNATWHLAPRFDLSFGARQSWNDQVASQVADGVLVGGLLKYDDATSSESPFTFSISPRYELSKDSSVYVRVATGFRPGGPNVLPPGAPEDTPSTYDADRLTSYEVGWKSTGFDGRAAADVSLYYLDWEDIQLLAVVNGFGINANGGTAVSKGAEFALSFIPVDGWTLSLNGAYTDASLTQDTDPIVGGLDGDPLPYVPEWSYGLAADYEWSVRGDSLLFVGGSLGYVDDRVFDYGSRDDAGDLLRIDSYVTVDLRAGIYSGRWSLELYGRNLTSEEGVVSVDTGGNLLPNGAYGLALIRPRTIGLSLGVRFWDS